MNKQKLRAVMVEFGDTQGDLAEALGVGLSTLNAKINEYGTAQFRQSEIAFIKERYNLTASAVDEIFFSS